ncbi:FAD/FMN-dependent dehydrogenase [Opitutaceae bacterium TAV1]|nr:FAD/FMN-dependent dehydrogenase [Opitutaceae bacterium TAV1]
MSVIPDSLPSRLADLVGESGVIRGGTLLETLSRDFYWYSPVLKRQLGDKRADLVVRPGSMDELRGVLSACFAARVPVVPRGGGTGNYGQCVPLYGGVVVDLSRLDRILEITTDGVLRCEPGARLGVIEPEARKQGWELRCLPSTWVKSSLGGFFCGGSGGVGSVTWGGIASPGNVKSVTLMTCEAGPRLIRLEEADCTRALHTYGTTGFMVEIEMRLAPKVAWEQLAFAGDDWDRLIDWTDGVGRDASVRKRLVTMFESPVPSFFKPLGKYYRPGEHGTFLLVENTQADAVAAAAQAAGIRLAHRIPLADPPKPPYFTDYTWNHTTLWAMKADPAITYLQCGYGDEFRTRIKTLRDRFPGEILQHLEWVASGVRYIDGDPQRITGDNIRVSGIPLIRFSTEERLREIIDCCAEIGVFVANPHTFKLEEGGRHPDLEAKRELKAEADPAGLLNPGKMASYANNPFVEPAA